MLLNPLLTALRRARLPRRVLLTTAGILLAGVGISASAAETTVSFSSTEPTAWNDGIAEDGDGGSADIPGKVIQFYPISDTSGTHVNLPLIHPEFSRADGFVALTTYDPSVNDDGFKGMAIRSQDGSAFQLNGFFYSNWGEGGATTITVKGYNDGVEVASTTFTTALVDFYQSKAVTLDGSFDHVDEVRVFSADGLSWHGLNDVKIDDAVVSPADQNFDSLTATEGANGSGSLTVGDLVFSANGSATVETYDVSGFWGGSFTGHSGKAVIGNYNGSISTSITYFRFRSVDLADDFRLNSMTVLANEIESGYNYAVKYKMEGFNGGPSGTLVVSVSEVNLLTSGTYGSGNAAITYTRSGSFASDWANGGSLVFGSAWDNIDTVVFTVTDGVAVQLSLDSLDFSPPAPANSAPTDISLSNSTVNQSGGANATVGTLSTTDADNGDTHTYTLVSGTGDTHNASFNLSGSSLRANNAGALAAGNYSVRVQTDDGNGGTYAEAFTVTVADDVAPTVVSVAAPTNGTYRASVFLDFTVSLTEPVTVLGVPALEVTVGATARTATFHSGGGTTNLVFRHTVQVGDEDTDGVAVGTLTLAGGTIRDAAVNNAVLTLNNVASTAGVLVDGVAPLISSITRKTPSQQVVDTATLVFEVTFSEDVTNVETSVFAVTPVNGGTITGSVSGVSGGPRIYDVTVEITGGLGEFRLDVNGQ